MKPGGGPLTLIVAYQYPPISTWAVSAKMHHRASVSFAIFLGTFLRKISDCRNSVSNSERYVIRMLNYMTVVYVIATIISLHCEHKKRI